MIQSPVRFYSEEMKAQKAGVVNQQQLKPIYQYQSWLIASNN